MALIFLFVKHYICDFVLQSQAMIAGKGIYGNVDGIQHSVYHAIGTLIVVSLFVSGPMALFLALADGVIHYHLDYLKMKYGETDNTTKEYWRDFGLDQMAHSITYVLIAGLL